MGFDPWNGNPNYASLPLPSTAKREGREFTKPFQQLSSRSFTNVAGFAAWPYSLSSPPIRFVHLALTWPSRFCPIEAICLLLPTEESGEEGVS